MTEANKCGVIGSRLLALIVAGSFLLSLLFFSPRLWLMREPVPGSYQWARGISYLQQCDQPFRHDIEPAMQWRLLPPLTAHFLRLPGLTPLIFPWVGVIALLWYIAVLHARRLPDIRFVFGGTLLAATTSAVLVPVGWLGVNDAWVWLGLLGVAFGRANWAIPIACILCPWIDERFIIGLPLAWMVHCLEENTPLFTVKTLRIGWLLPYVAVRLACEGNPLSNATESHFINTQLHSIATVVPMAPFGWWMGLRAGWLGVGYTAFTLPNSRRIAASLILAATLAVSLFLASDISRSIAIVLPAMILGGFVLARQDPGRASKIITGVACANLLIPAAHVILTHIDPINPLPVELIRLFRS